MLPPYSSQVVSLKVPEKLPSGLTYSTVPPAPRAAGKHKLILPQFCEGEAMLHGRLRSACRLRRLRRGGRRKGLPAARQGEGGHSGQSEGRCVVYPHLIHLMPVRWIQCTTFVDIILLKTVTNFSQMVTARERPRTDSVRGRSQPSRVNSSSTGVSSRRASFIPKARWGRTCRFRQR